MFLDLQQLSSMESESPLGTPLRDTDMSHLNAEQRTQLDNLRRETERIGEMEVEAMLKQSEDEQRTQ